MDPSFPGNSSDFINGYQFGDDDGTAIFSDPNQYATYWDLDEPYRSLLNFTNADPFNEPDDADPLGFASRTTLNSEGLQQFVSSSSSVSPVEGASNTASAADSSLEDTDFSETAKYISQMLMEENFEQKPYYDPLSLQVTEKSFYDALSENLPLSPNQHPLDLLQNVDSADGNSSGSGSGSGSTSTSTSTSNSNNDSPDLAYHDNSPEFKPPSPETPLSGDHAFQFKSPPISHSHTPCQPPPNASTTIVDGLLDLDSSITKLLAQSIFSDADSVSQFNRGLEEARKFLPRGPQLVTGLESSPVTVSPESKGEVAEKATVNRDNAARENSHGSKSRKNHEREGSDTEEEGRSNKQSAVGGVDESDLSDMFDRVLLGVENVPLCGDNDCLQNGPVTAATPTQPGERPRSSDGGKTRSRKQGRKKETIDLRTLLILCAQAVSANDNRTATELLKQIRQHSSPFGDASQRMAHYFANGLEARLAGDGTGAQGFYNSLMSSKRFTAADFLKAYQFYISACPFKKFLHFFANKMILKVAENADTLHIIDFGILYGFQWPILIKFLSERGGGPPKLRMTGIELPQPGFRPGERIEETGRRLENYCKRYGVPFEYNAISSRSWETIPIEDLKIKSNELLVVNCLLRFKDLLDETIEVNSPRNAVLNLIRKINPDLFVQSIVNGSYNAPFFATRFREALFHFSAIYDMCDTVLPRENEWRMVIEKELVGRGVMNVVACEGFERVERPETYKQWQVRNTRAGFKQLQLNKELMAKFRDKLRKWYHRDFVLDEDNNWMLQGWKGRILYASTCWVPA